MAPKKKNQKNRTNRARSSKSSSGGGAAHPSPIPPPPSDLPFPAAFRPPPAPISFSFSGASHPPAPADSPPQFPFAGASHPSPPSSPLPIPPLPFDYTSIPPRSAPAAARPSSDVALTIARHTIKGAAASRGRLSGPTARASLEQGLERLGDTLPTMMSAILTIQDLAEGIIGGEGLAEAGVGARRNMDMIRELYEATRKMVRKKAAAAPGTAKEEEQGDVDFSRDLREEGDRGSS